MADISKIEVPNGTSYTLKDATGRKEAYLEWGGRNFAGSYGCIDAAMVNDLGANRLAFPAVGGITIEYSRDGGSTWTNYGATNDQKLDLFSRGGTAFTIGKADTSHLPTNDGKFQLRVTLATGTAKIYTALNKFVFLISTSSSSNCYVKIQKALESTPTTIVDHTDWIGISGWSGYNVVNCDSITTYGNTPASQYGRLIFLFKGNGGNTSYLGLRVIKIMGFGGVGWITPSNMAKIGHLYSFDPNQNATFPAKINSTGGTMTGQLVVTGTASSKPIKARNIVGNAATGTTGTTDAELYLQYGNTTSDAVYFGNTGGGRIHSDGTQYTGNAATATYSESAGDAASVNGHTVEKDVPSDAVFTDHTYSGTGLISVNSSGVISTTATNNTGTVTGVKINGTTKSPSSGIVDIGTVATSNTTYSFANGTGCFSVTPSGGSAQTVTVTPALQTYNINDNDAIIFAHQGILGYDAHQGNANYQFPRPFCYSSSKGNLQVSCVSGMRVGTISKVQTGKDLTFVIPKSIANDFSFGGIVFGRLDIVSFIASFNADGSALQASKIVPICCYSGSPNFSCSLGSESTVGQAWFVGITMSTAYNRFSFILNTYNNANKLRQVRAGVIINGVAYYEDANRDD